MRSLSNIPNCEFAKKSLQYKIPLVNIYRPFKQIVFYATFLKHSPQKRSMSIGWEVVGAITNKSDPVLPNFLFTVITNTHKMVRRVLEHW